MRIHADESKRTNYYFLEGLYNITLMTVITEPPPNVDLETDDQLAATKQPRFSMGKTAQTLERIIESKRVKTAVVLGTIACWAYNAEVKGDTKHFGMFQHVAESGAHPFLGYVGAWLGHMAVQLAQKRYQLQERTARRLSVISGSAGIVAGDLAGELAIGFHAGAGFDFLNHRYESIKDFIAAAAVGGGIYVGQHWRANKKPKKRV